MNKLFSLLFIVGLLFCIPSCSVNEAFVSSVDSAWEVIGPEYTAYVDADPLLDSASKATRKRTATALSDILKTAKAKK